MRHRPARVVPEIAYADPDNPFVTLYRDRLEMPDGSVRRYNRIIENAGRAGVVVLPIRGDAIGLVEQYRYPVGAMCLELPRGFAGDGSALENAMRELREETGLAPDAGAFLDLGVLHPDSGLLAGSVQVFAVRIDAHAPARVEDTDEVARLHWLARDEFGRRIAGDTIRDAFTLAAVAKARARGLW